MIDDDQIPPNVAGKYPPSAPNPLTKSILQLAREKLFGSNSVPQSGKSKHFSRVALVLFLVFSLILLYVMLSE